MTPTQTIRICILQNRAVLGEKKIRGIIKYDYYPAIITPEQFTAVKDATVKKVRLKILYLIIKWLIYFRG